MQHHQLRATFPGRERSAQPIGTHVHRFSSSIKCTSSTTTIACNEPRRIQLVAVETAVDSPRGFTRVAVVPASNQCWLLHDGSRQMGCRFLCTLRQAQSCPALWAHGRGAAVSLPPASMAFLAACAASGCAAFVVMNGSERLWEFLQVVLLLQATRDQSQLGL